MAGLSVALPGGGGLGIGGMGLPPLQMSSSATARLEQQGNSFGASFGDWTVNVSGSGKATQSATSAPFQLTWWMVAAGVGAAWLLLK